MKLQRTFLVDVVLDDTQLNALDAVAGDLQETLLDSGFDVADVRPWQSPGSSAQDLSTAGFPVQQPTNNIQ